MEILKKIDIKNKKVLIRVDYNVPISKGQITDNFRILSSVPTIKYCLSQGASIILMSHIGRPEGQYSEDFSLDPIAFELEDILGTEVMFSSDCISDDSIELSSQMKAGEIHLLENLRFHKGEIENDITFAWNLSRHAEIYVNDAFGTAHRKHASNVGILQFMKIKAIGLLMEKEKKYLLDIFRKKNDSTCLILGGSKVKDKIQLIQNLLYKIDYILIGGAMAFPFLKNAGYNIGSSFCEPESLSYVKDIINMANKNNVKLIIPVDVLVSKKLGNNSRAELKNIDNIGDKEAGFDIGPETTLKFQHYLVDV